MCAHRASPPAEELAMVSRRAVLTVQHYPCRLSSSAARTSRVRAIPRRGAAYAPTSSGAVAVSGSGRPRPRPGTARGAGRPGPPGRPPGPPRSAAPPIRGRTGPPPPTGRSGPARGCRAPARPRGARILAVCRYWHACSSRWLVITNPAGPCRQRGPRAVLPDIQMTGFGGTGEPGRARPAGPLSRCRPARRRRAAGGPRPRRRRAMSPGSGSRWPAAGTSRGRPPGRRLARSFSGEVFPPRVHAVLRPSCSG
jgi:hypothetical protein